MIIAIDFDGTLVQHKFPEIGEPIEGAFEVLKIMKNDGHKLILWTCRTDVPAGNFLTQAVEFCKSKGIEFDAINDNIQPYQDNIYTNCRKVYADLYLDDKAIKYETGYWKTILNIRNTYK